KAEKARSAESCRFPNHDTAKKGLPSIPATAKTAVKTRYLNHLPPQNKPKTAENLTIRPDRYPTAQNHGRCRPKNLYNGRTGRSENPPA
ncbi:hypothetical protein, partial [Acetobacter tropicalis]|uniref:hypothetical protein n=1 Tax=Acetobacter tropicalis TaxID=104102 RepID=UPI001E639C49